MSTGIAPQAEAAAQTEPFRMGNIGRHTLIYGVGVIAQRALSIVMLPVYTRFMTPSDYGALQLIFMTLEIATIFAGSRIGWGIYRFYHKAKTPEEKNAVLSTALMILAVSFATVGVLIFTFAPTVALVVFGWQGENPVLLVRLGAGSLAFEGLVHVPVSYIMLSHRSKLFVKVSVAKLIFQSILNVIFLIPLGMGAAGVLLSTFIANGTFGLLLSAYLIYNVGRRFSRSAFADLFRFGLPLVHMQIATFILTFGDRYVLNRAADTAAVGIYSLAYIFGFILVIIGYSPFSRVWDPMRFEIAKRDDRDVIYSRVFIYMNLMLVTIGVGIALFTKDLLRIMADPAFHSAADLVPLLLVAYLLHAWTRFHNLGIFIVEKTQYFSAANWVAAGVSVVGYLTLIPLYHGWGAAISTLLAFAIRQVMVYYWSQKLWRVNYQWGPVNRLAAVAVMVCLAGIFAPDTSVPVSIMIRVGLVALYAGAIWSLNILSHADRAFVRRALRSPRRAMAALRG
jgi:O-antigen/teichoic acid export membrane protein